MPSKRKTQPYDPADDHYGALVAIPAQPPRRTDENARKPKRARAVAYTSCPDCAGLKVAVVEHSGHLLYREREKVTMSGARMPCRASGTRACENPPPARIKDNKGRAVYCGHDQGRGAVGA